MSIDRRQVVTWTTLAALLALGGVLWAVVCARVGPQEDGVMALKEEGGTSRDSVSAVGAALSESRRKPVQEEVRPGIRGRILLHSQPVAGGVLSIYAGDPIALAFQGDAARPLCEAVTDDTGRFDIAWRNDFANYVVLRSQDVRFFISDIVIESPVDLGEINASSRQPPIVVEVVDADGVPLSGALIAIEVSGAAPSVSVETNA